MESSHVVGVGRLSVGAQQRGEGREQLHAAGLLRPQAAPVCVLQRNKSLAEQLENTCRQEEETNNDSAAFKYNMKSMCFGWIKFWQRPVLLWSYPSQDVS